MVTITHKKKIYCVFDNNFEGLGIEILPLFLGSELYQSKNARLVICGDLTSHSKYIAQKEIIINKKLFPDIRLYELFFINNVLYDDNNVIIGSKITDNIIFTSINYTTLMDSRILLETLFKIPSKPYKLDFLSLLKENMREKAKDVKKENLQKKLFYPLHIQHGNIPEGNFMNTSRDFLEYVMAKYFKTKDESPLSLDLVSSYYKAISFTLQSTVMLLTKTISVKKTDIALFFPPFFLHLTIRLSEMFMSTVRANKDGSYIHPHITDKRGGICKGNIVDNVRIAREMYDYNSLIVYLSDLLDSYGSGPHQHFNITICICGLIELKAPLPLCDICKRPACKSCRITRNSKKIHVVCKRKKS